MKEMGAPDIQIWGREGPWLGRGFPSSLGAKRDLSLESEMWRYLRIPVGRVYTAGSYRHQERTCES